MMHQTLPYLIGLSDSYSQVVNAAVNQLKEAIKKPF